MGNGLRTILETLDTYSIVETVGKKVSNEPMYSERFWYCQGVVLFGDEEAGLAHVLPNQDVNPYIDYFIENMKNIDYAVLMRNTKLGADYQKFFLKSFSDKNIPILKTFQGVVKKSIYKDLPDYIYKRSLLVLPDTKEVLVGSELGIERWNVNDKS